VVPPHPKSLHQAFRLGQLSSRCTKWIGSCPASALQEAEDVVGRPVSSEELLGVEDLVVSIDAKNSIVNRLFGLLNFVNVVMFFSTLGILATLGPFLATVLGPIVRRYGPYFLSIIRAISHILERLLSPILEFVFVTLPPLLHRWGVLEACGYALAFLLVTTAARYPPEHDGMRCMLAVAGCLAEVPLVLYSVSLHGALPKDSLYQINGMLALAFTPLAYAFQSQLGGFLAMLCAYQALGFVASSSFLGYEIGFTSNNSMIRCAVSSKLLLVTYASLRVWGGATDEMVAPFALSVQILGSVVYFLALLIEAWWPWSDRQHYLRSNALMAASIFLYALFGNIWGLPALSNTAITFLVLWLMKVQADLVQNGVVATFVACCASAWACHHLSTHPAFLLSLLEPKGLFVGA
jgi:hypothetical protein